MVNISIDVTDLGGEARPGDKVVLWKPAAAGSSSHAGRVISTAPVDVFLTNGKASVPDVEPGEMRVLLQCRGVESQGPIDVTVPDGNGTVTLRSLIESQFEYAPPIVSAVQEAAANASASERAAIEAQVRSEAAADRADAKVDDAINNGANLIRDEVKQDADRAVSARQAATQSETKAKASEGKAATSELNAKTSETNAKQSETNAGDYAAVATTAATEAVDAMERATDLAGGDFATHEYVDTLVDSSRYAQSTALEAGTDLDTLWHYTDSKVYRLVAGRTYTNLPQGNSLTTNGTLIVSSTGTAGMQVLTQNSSGNVYWRPMHNSTVVPRTWWPWRRLDSGQLESTLDLTFQRRAQLGEGVDLNTLRGNTENGIRILGSHGNYPNRPTDGWSDGIAGAIVVFSTGLGDTWQRVWQRHSGHVWERRESAPGSFTPWERVRNSGPGDTPPTTTALALPQTTFEAVGMLTTYEEGEAYLDLLNARQPIIEVRQFGQSNQGRPIRGIVIGDDTKPALFIMCAQHGDEVSGREAAFAWARQISEMRPDFLEKICVVVVPTVNADKINIRRLTSTGTDLNGGWQSRVTNEVQAVYAGIESFDTRAVIDAHEGGSWTQVQFCGGTAPEIDPAVRAANDDFYDAVWSAVENGGGAHPPAHWDGSDKLTNARNAIPHQVGVPCLLVEMPGQLARAGWNGPGPDPRIYQPNLKNRVESYQLIFKGAAEYLAGTIPTGEA